MKATWEAPEMGKLLAYIDRVIAEFDAAVARCQSKVDAEQAEWDAYSRIYKLLTTNPSKRSWLETSQAQDDLHFAKSIRRKTKELRRKVEVAKKFDRLLGRAGQTIDPDFRKMRDDAGFRCVIANIAAATPTLCFGPGAAGSAAAFLGTTVRLTSECEYSLSRSTGFRSLGLNREVAFLAVLGQLGWRSPQLPVLYGRPRAAAAAKIARRPAASGGGT